jgi:protein involved in temperature-dependent protein secretion
MAAHRGIGPAAAGPSDDLRDRLDASAASLDVPKLVALIGRGEAVWVNAAGVRDLDSAVPTMRDTVFAVASIRLDDPVDAWMLERADRRVDGALDDTVAADRADLGRLLTAGFRRDGPRIRPRRHRAARRWAAEQSGIARDLA